MINNRQNGRRRGRGGGGPRTPNNAPNTGGNRQDTRSRGNATQLHEKYKALARDAQLQGDRVQAEYYLQFADHYFRVLNEGRARFEEQRPQRDDDGDDYDQDDAVNAGESDDRDDRDDRDQRPERQQRPEREPRREQRADRGDREPRADREPRNDREARPEREPRPEREARNDGDGRSDGEARPRRARAPRPERNDSQDDAADARISVDILPPAISADIGGEAPKPRRRIVRRPRDEGDADIAPAA